jgi:hypothetical protein
MKRTCLWRCALLIIIGAFLLNVPACGKKADPIPPKTEPPKAGTAEQTQQPKTGTSVDQPQQPKTDTSAEQPEKPAGGTPGK